MGEAVTVLARRRTGAGGRSPLNETGALTGPRRRTAGPGPLLPQCHGPGPRHSRQPWDRGAGALAGAGLRDRGDGGQLGPAAGTALRQAMPMIFERIGAADATGMAENWLARPRPG